MADDQTPFVSLEDLGDFMNAPTTMDDPKQSTLLQECLDAALEAAQERVGPLDNAAVDYVVWPSGRSLVLPDTDLVSIQSVTDPDGHAVTVTHPNLAAGVIDVDTWSTAPGPWTVTVVTRELGASVSLAVKIIASHLYEIHRPRSFAADNAMTGGGVLQLSPDTNNPTVRTGFAIPARAAQLLAPFQRADGF